MSFISYAQNLEDVMLYRALNHVEHGFYIDVGAQHPVVDSVTKAFYDRGWRGINVEPTSEYFRLLQQYRPMDINLQVAASAYQGEVLFYEIMHEGLSTIEETYANRHANAGYKVRPLKVICTTLDAICMEHNVHTVHFLKIDVEGAEKQVLEGFAFANVRPWIVVVEANKPSSTRDVSQEWEPLLLKKDYRDVYYYGLNRFYIAVEHSELEERFQVPPTVYDAYITYPHYLAQKELDQLRLSNMVARKKYSNLPWFLTAPARKGKQLLGALLALIVWAMRYPARVLLKVAIRSQRLRRFGMRLLAVHPEVRSRLLRMAGVTSPDTIRRQAPRTGGAAAKLPESAREIYYELRELRRVHLRKQTERT